MNKTEEKENYQTNLGFVTIAPLDENSTVGKVSTPHRRPKREMRGNN